MKFFLIPFFLLVVVGFVWFFFRERPIRWLVFYGDTLSNRTLMNVDLAILEPDNISPSSLNNKRTLFFGYVSVGEVNTDRDYWPEVMDKKFIVEINPDWKGAWRVDIRSPEWQQLLLEKVIPEILQKGYQGIFLDTVDTAAYLEEKNREKFAGSKKAMVSFIRSIQKKFPDILILPNNALELLSDYGDIIYGVVVEDLYTHCDFAKRICTKTPLKNSLYREESLNFFRKHFKKPVFNILYGYSANKELIHYAVKRSEKKGYHWYLTNPNLTELGTIGR